MVHKIPREQISVADRQRSGDFKRDIDLRKLRNSIEEEGLLHPIVIGDLENGKYPLIAGGRRLASIDWLREENIELKCNKEIYPAPLIPATFLTEAQDLLLRLEAEFAENEARQSLEWQDRNAALIKIHNLKKEINPVASVTQIAATLSETMVGKSARAIEAQMLTAIKINQHISDPAIKHARTQNEAYSLALKKEEAQLRSILVKQSHSVPDNIKVIEGDAFVELSKLSPGIIDLILADPPYGIQAGAEGFRNRTVHHHNYEDTPDTARKFISNLLIEGFRITRSRANIFIFCDIDLWPWLREQAEKAGWTPFRTPIVWCKSDSEGLAPWGAQGFRRTYELIFFATKGQRGLVKSPVDILRHARVSRSERDYAAAKPVPLISELIECATLPGELVLDPCCGSGATVVAAKNLKRAVIGIEKDSTAYNLTMAKLNVEPAQTDVSKGESNGSEPETQVADL